jgi:hypothetical protein
MGSGDYSSVRRMASGRTDHYKTAAPSDIFKAKTVNSAMNPKGIKLRGYHLGLGRYGVNGKSTSPFGQRGDS